jgi:NADH:ubiquinone oxidoreductase subunit 3 (subunit A)
MGQRVFIELLLFLAPFAVFLVYRAASRDMMIRDRWPLTTLVLVGAGLAVAALVIGPLLEPSEQGKCYQAAQYINGKTIPAKEVPCAEAKPPGQQSDPNAQQRPAPVAPRDEGK